MYFEKLDPYNLPQEAKKFLSEGVKRSPSNFFCLEDYIIGAKNKKNMIFSAFDENILKGAFILNINSGNGRKILVLSLLGGINIKSWRDDLVKFLFDMANRNECTDFSMIGRVGWGKLFPEMKLDGCIYSRKLI